MAALVTCDLGPRVAGLPAGAPCATGVFNPMPPLAN